MSQLPNAGTNPFSEAHQFSQYKQYVIRTRYIWNNGTGLLPVAKPGNSPNQVLPSVITQTSSPFGYKVVSWVAERVAFIPVMPNPEPDNPNQILYSHDITFEDAQVEGANAMPVYRATGEYIYLLKQPISVKDGLMHIGNQPILAMAQGPSVNVKDFSNYTPTGGNEQPG